MRPTVSIWRIVNSMDSLIGISRYRQPKLVANFCAKLMVVCELNRLGILINNTFCGPTMCVYIAAATAESIPQDTQITILDIPVCFKKRSIPNRRHKNMLSIPLSLGTVTCSEGLLVLRYLSEVMQTCSSNGWQCAKVSPLGP